MYIVHNSKLLELISDRLTFWKKSLLMLFHRIFKRIQCGIFNVDDHVPSDVNELYKEGLKISSPLQYC